MGMVLGKISEETPAFTVLHKAVSYEVRKYGPSVVAECSYGPGGWGNGNDGSPFGALAKYIGVFGKAQNEQKGASEAIAMTAPVLVTNGNKPTTELVTPPASQQIAMTAPVLVTPSDSSTMAFVLPSSKYKTVAEAPTPTDPRVTLRQLPERVQAVRTFTWSFKPEAAKSQLQRSTQLLLADLAVDEWFVVKRADGEAEWQAAGYNPPFTLPFLKTNEVMVSVQPKA